MKWNFESVKMHRIMQCLELHRLLITDYCKNPLHWVTFFVGPLCFPQYLHMHMKWVSLLWQINDNDNVNPYKLHSLWQLQRLNMHLYPSPLGSLLLSLLFITTVLLDFVNDRGVVSLNNSVSFTLLKWSSRTYFLMLLCIGVILMEWPDK